MNLVYSECFYPLNVDVGVSVYPYNTEYFTSTFTDRSCYPGDASNCDAVIAARGQGFGHP